jgi:cytochrome c-type protein NapC
MHDAQSLRECGIRSQARSATARRHKICSLRGRVFPLWSIIALGAAILIVALLFHGAATLSAHRVGRLVLLVGLVGLPLLVSLGGLSQGVAESSRTRFCLSCHEMQDHGKSLFVDDRHALAAAHYQSRLIDRDTICFSCHTDYALFGDFKAKLNGLRHVWAHYVAGVPQKIALYRPYENANCLHCHEDSRRFLEAPPHKAVLAQVSSGALSCLGCHRPTHDLDKVRERRFWQAD